MEASFLLPDVDDADSAPFWQGCTRAELLLQACADCGAIRMPPRPMCPHCHSLKQRWQPSAGRGTVWSFVVPHPPLLPAYSELAPFNVIVVALDDHPGVRLVGNLVATADAPINSVAPESIRIGEPVRVVFQPIGGATLPRWVRDDRR